MRAASARVRDRPADERRMGRPARGWLTRRVGSRVIGAGRPVAPGGSHRREEADRGEAWNRVDLGQVDRPTVEQEIEPGEALGAHRPVGVARDLQDRGPLVRLELGTGRGLGQARRVLGGVVIELVARQDLAGTVQLQPGRVVADDPDLELAGLRDVALGEGQRVVLEGRRQGAGTLARIVGQGHPHRAAEPSRFDDQAGIAGPAGERLELGQDAGRVGQPAPRGDLPPIDHRQAQTPNETLEQRLVHAHCRGRHAGPGVGQVGCLEQSLDGAVLAERAVKCDEHDRSGLLVGQPLEDGATRQRTSATEGRRVVEIGRDEGGGAGACADRAGQPPPAAVEVDQDPAHSVTGLGEGTGHRRARDDRDVVLGRWPAEEDDDRRPRTHGAGSGCHRPQSPR
jgi:hypothetical protein